MGKKEVKKLSFELNEDMLGILNKEFDVKEVVARFKSAVAEKDLDEASQDVFGKYGHRSTIFKIVTDFLGRESPVDGQHDGSNGRCRSIKEKIFKAVFPQNPDAIALVDAGLLQAAGQTIYLFLIPGKC